MISITNCLFSRLWINYAIMAGLLFVVFVILLGIVFIASMVVAHSEPGRMTAAWWAGVTLSLVVFTSVQSSFLALPINPAGEVAWPPVFKSATEVSFVAFIGATIVGFILFHILFDLNIPERVAALMMLLLSFCSLSLMLYAFLIRTITNVFFSITMGVFLSLLLYGAFSSFMDDSEKKKKKN